MRISLPASRSLAICSALVVALIEPPLAAVELVQLDQQNWDEYAPEGKEADCIYGDYVLRNENIVAVIAKPIETRNANMTVRRVGGAVIDLTRREPLSDQLSAFYPAGDYPLRQLHLVANGDSLTEVPAKGVRRNAVSVQLSAEASAGSPSVAVVYSLADGSDWLLVKTTYSNPHQQPLELSLSGVLRADGEFEMGQDDSLNLFWAYDAHWQQAYGVVAEGDRLVVEPESLRRRRPVLRYQRDGTSQFTLPPGESATVSRRLFPARDLLGVKAIAARLADASLETVRFFVRDADGQAVAGARLDVSHVGAQLVGSGRTDRQGNLAAQLPLGEYALRAHAHGRPELNIELKVASGENQIQIEFGQLPGYVKATITDGSGAEIPCKLGFFGTAGTPDPNWGPDSAIRGVRNLRYTPNGQVRAEILPGRYEVVISHGPEYDAVVQTIEVRAGEETRIEAQLVRTVDTTGWLSAELHSHSSPSGDNTSHQRGRVLNLLAEHLEFGPCTEHNRISTYLPHLKHFDAVARMATCSGMELTGRPLPINHQNAFPLKRNPRTQDGGAPVTDENPVIQIERLAMWDGNSDKLVQTNHPNIVQMVGDRDMDGTPDGGFEKMFGYMDVIEVHPLAPIFTPPEALQTSDRDRGNTIFNWLQLLNVGYRVPGVVNTDAHWNFHGSGGLRNYVQSETDRPGEAEIMDLVHDLEDGRIVMTNGPFMTASAIASLDGKQVTAGVGDELKTDQDYVELLVRVQCPNWLGVNRVQVLVNGHLDPQLNFTERTHPQLFLGVGVVKFDHRIRVKLEQDAHLIVAAAGEGLKLGRVMGPQWGEAMPVAVSNPIFVDVDGEGFEPSGDMLGLPLPLGQAP